MHSSVYEMWQAYLVVLGETPQNTAKQFSSWYFCDNEQDADELAELVKNGCKRATSPSLWWFEATNEPLPRIGDLSIITNWAGEAQCIIQTVQVDIVPFSQIDSDYAAIEGEGDGSLKHWRLVHWNYYQRELEEVGKVPQENMPIVCEQFRVVYPNLT